MKTAIPAAYCIVKGNHLSALKEEISLCSRVFYKQLNEKRVVFIALKPETAINLGLVDNRNLAQLRAEVIKNWDISEKAKQVIYGITD